MAPSSPSLLPAEAGVPRGWRRTALARAATLALATAAAVAPAPGALAATRPAPAPLALAAIPPASAPTTLTGWATLRRLDLLPLFQPGVTTSQFSSYDRTGGNDDGRTYSCLRLTADERCVVAERSGPGEVDSIWFTRDGGDVRLVGNLRIDLDGRRVLDAPLQQVVDGALGAPFTFPLVANASQSSGGVYIKVPMAFRESMRISTSEAARYYHVTYRALPSADGVASFDPSDRAADVVGKLAAAGTRDPKPPPAGATTVSRRFTLPAGRAIALTGLVGPGVVTALRLRLGRLTPARSGQLAPAVDLMRLARLRISFDGRRTVDSPLGELFGSGLAPAPVRSLMFSQSPGTLTSWWPMPFRRTASVSLVNASHTGVLSGQLLVTYAPEPAVVAALASGRAGYFHASSQRGPTVPGQDWTALAVRGRRGKLVGISHTMSGTTNDYLEGDERAFIDTDGAPEIQGTGTEDFYEGGFYFNHGPFTAAFNGNPVRLVGAGPLCPTGDCTDAYRLLLDDSIGFASSLRFGFEHGSGNSQAAVYGTTAYWYG